MNRTHPRPIITALLGAGLLLAALVPAASAAPPKWTITATERTEFASAGQAAAFDITISNNGRSNISSLYLLAFSDPLVPTVFTEAPVYAVSPERPGECGIAGAGLLCDFGALNAGVTIHATVAYTMPASGTFSVYFGLNSTGLVLGGNNSHGDAKFTTVQQVDVAPATDINRGGKFTLVANGEVFNSNAVSSSNVQATRVFNLQQYVGATVEDGSTVSFDCPKAKCKAKLFGEWSDVNVNNGEIFLVPFSIELIVAKSAVPNNLTESNLNTVVLYHVTADGTVETISQLCGAVVPAGGCLDGLPAFDAQGNLHILAKVFYNGGYKSGI